MTNGAIVDILEQTTRLLELHEADAFKIKSYGAAAYGLDRVKDAQIADLTFGQLTQITGVGKGIAGKVQEIVQTGQLRDLTELLALTPEGVLQMFGVKGIGPKKIRKLWLELGIDNLKDLRSACETGQIAALKGFGEKIQQQVLDSLIFLEQQIGRLRMDKAEALAQDILEQLEKHFEVVEITGQVRRKTETVDTVQLLLACEQPNEAQRRIAEIPFLIKNEKQSTPFVWRGKAESVDVAVEIVGVETQKFEGKMFILNAAEAHLAQRGSDGRTLYSIAQNETITDPTEVYTLAGLPYIAPEMREGAGEFEWAATHQNEDLITWDDLRGILHNHSTYSDGKHTLLQMARRCQELGFGYFGIADHSQSATYAQGLSEERVRQQQAEIDDLNQQFATEGSDFRILKGIEADILGDGMLDYPDDVLASFDYVVASVHSNLTMTQEKATTRLLRAIENPYTTILGHPTGRLLLARDGYPIDHKAIIDACAARGVVIELNASPYRLDLDWRWIRYCIEKNVKLSINPDAHEMDGFYDMHYGVAVARKGGLTRQMTFNALTLGEMQHYLKNRRPV